MNKVVIGIGSNIDSEINIKKAQILLRKEFSILAESRYIQTKPIGVVNQADFINGVALLETELDQGSLNNKLKQLELGMGRKKSLQKFGPRIIDFDIIVWNQEIVDEDYHSRGFLKELVGEVYKICEY